MTYIMQILRAGDARENSLKALCCVEVPNGKKKKNHYIFSSQPRADQMPGPPREGQLMCTLFLSTRPAIFSNGGQRMAAKAGNSI